MKRTVALLFCFLGLYMPLSDGMAESTQNIPATIDGGNADQVHLRAEPSITSASLGLYFTGTELSCETDPAQEWTKVLIGSQEGYIKSEFLRWGDVKGSVQSQQPTGTIKTNGRVSMHSAPSEEAPIKQKLYAGDSVSVLGQTASHWYLVTAPHGTGYVSCDHICLQDQPAQSKNSFSAADELSFEFGRLAFHYGDPLSDIMKKSDLVGYPFERLGEHKIYYYSTYNEAEPVECCIGIGFDDDQHVDYVSLQGSGVFNKTIKYPITFDELTRQIGESISPQIFITQGKVDTVCYLWSCGSYSIQAMAWPLSANNPGSLNVESIDVYSIKRAPVQQIVPTPGSTALK